MKLIVTLEVETTTPKEEMKESVCNMSDAEFVAWTVDFIKEYYTGDEVDDTDFTYKVLDLKVTDELVTTP